MIRLEIDTEETERALVHIIRTAAAPVNLFKRIHAHQQSQSALMFRALKHGGTRRGVTWDWYAPQYTRKTDGVTVPAEGGVSRLDGRGVVLGRLRASGPKSKSKARIDARSNLLRDTRQLSGAVASVRRIRNRGRTLEIITPVKYAAAQQAKRPFTFFTREDADLYEQWAAEELTPP